MIVLAAEVVNRRLLPVFDIVKLPLQLRSLDIVVLLERALLKVTFPKVWPIPPGYVLVIPVILQFDAAFHVAVGTVPLFWLCRYVAPLPKESLLTSVHVTVPEFTMLVVTVVRTDVPFVL